MSEATVVTGETRAEFMAQKLGLAETQVPQEAANEGQSAPASESKQEPVTDDKQTEAAKSEEGKEPDKKPNPKLEKRFSELTAKRDAAIAEAQREKAQREAAEAELARLKGEKAPEAAKSGKPDPSQYTDQFQYAEDLARHMANEALEEREVKAKELEQQTAMQKQWAERMALAVKEIPDFLEMVQSSDIQVTDAVKHAVMTSEVGPQLLYHLAENPEVAAQLNGLPPVAAARMIGRLELQFEKKAEPEKPKVEVSKAPAPISPVKSASGTPDNLINDKGEFTGTPAQYRELRKAGKIK